MRECELQHRPCLGKSRRHMRKSCSREPSLKQREAGSSISFQINFRLLLFDGLTDFGLLKSTVPFKHGKLAECCRRLPFRRLLSFLVSYMLSAQCLQKSENFAAFRQPHFTQNLDLVLRCLSSFAKFEGEISLTLDRVIPGPGPEPGPGKLFSMIDLFCSSSV